MKKDTYITVGNDKQTGKETILRVRCVLPLAQISLQSAIEECSKKYDNIHLKKHNAPLALFYSVILRSYKKEAKAEVLKALKESEEVHFYYGNKEDEYMQLLEHVPCLVLWSTSYEKACRIQKSVDAAGGNIEMETIADVFFENENLFSPDIYIDDVQKHLIERDKLIQEKRILGKVPFRLSSLLKLFKK